MTRKLLHHMGGLLLLIFAHLISSFFPPSSRFLTTPYSTNPFHVHNSWKFDDKFQYRVQKLAVEANNFSENSMTVDELKAELELRGINYEDCISKNELVNRLITGRVSGKASKEILDKFNQLGDESDDTILSPEIFDDPEIQAKDGNLPGGLSPELMKGINCC